MHHVVANPAINMVEIRLSGFASLDDVAHLEAKLLDLFRSGKLKPDYLALSDISDCAIQSQDVLAALIRTIGRLPKAKRIAVITASAMLRLQLDRVIDRPYLRSVTDRKAAMDWLIAMQEPAKAA